MRIFLPTTLTALADALDAGGFGGGPLTAYAAEVLSGEGDEEELAYEALLSAGDASLMLLAADPAAPRRRVVVAADVPDRIAGADPEEGPAAVRVDGTVPVKRFASVHVDDADAESAIAAAAADPEAGGQDEHVLMWYAVQELPYLLKEASVRP